MFGPNVFKLKLKMLVKSKFKVINCQKQTCELMTNCFLSISSFVGFLRVDLGVGTGFLLVAGDPGTTSAFGGSPFMS